jgi:serine/threonine protein kinase
MSPEVIKGKK